MLALGMTGKKYRVTFLFDYKDTAIYFMQPDTDYLIPLVLIHNGCIIHLMQINIKDYNKGGEALLDPIDVATKELDNLSQRIVPDTFEIQLFKILQNSRDALYTQDYVHGPKGTAEYLSAALDIPFEDAQNFVIQRLYYFEKKRQAADLENEQKQESKRVLEATRKRDYLADLKIKILNGEQIDGTNLVDAYTEFVGELAPRTKGAFRTKLVYVDAKKWSQIK